MKIRALISSVYDGDALAVGNHSVPTADVAVRKRHHRQDENLIFLPALYWNQQSCFSVSNARIYNKRMLCELDCVKCRGRVFFLKTTFLISRMKCG